jgi:opacity protein-like surface antigen
MVEQFQVNATSTAVGQQPLDQGPSGQLGSYAGFKVGYDFAVRDVQLAFGGPTPIRTAMELEGSYLGSYEKIPLYNVSSGGPTIGYETYNLNAYSVMLNGLIKFEDLPVTPYFGGGVGVVFMTALNHKMDVNGVVAGTSTTYTTATGSGQNTSLALQAIVGLERKVYENLTLFIEYKFLAFLDVKFAYGDEPTTSIPPVAGGSNSQNDFMANQILSAGAKWSF